MPPAAINSTILKWPARISPGGNFSDPSRGSEMRPTAGTERKLSASRYSRNKRSTSAQTSLSWHLAARNCESSSGAIPWAASNRDLTVSHLLCCASITALEFSVQPGLGHAPVALHRLGRDSENFCSFLDGQAPEEPHLDDARLTRIHFAETFQGGIQSQELPGPFWRKDQRLVQLNMLSSAATLIADVTACVID